MLPRNPGTGDAHSGSSDHHLVLAQPLRLPKTHCPHWKPPQADAPMAAVISSLNLFVVIFYTIPFFCQHWPLAEIALSLPVSTLIYFWTAIPAISSLCFAGQSKVLPVLSCPTGSPALFYPVAPSLLQSRLSSSFLTLMAHTPSLHDATEPSPPHLLPTILPPCS